LSKNERNYNSKNLKLKFDEKEIIQNKLKLNVNKKIFVV